MSEAELAARFLQGVGLADCPLDVAVAQVTSYGPGTSARFSLVSSTNVVSEALTFLSTLSWPATRHVLFACDAKVTAFINNSRNGSDYADYVYLMPRCLNCRFARVLNSEQRVWKRGQLRIVQQWAARIFDLYDARGESIRSVYCMNDGGRWDFHSTGSQLPLEPVIDTTVRKPDRFPAEQLFAVAAAFGLTVPTAAQFLNANTYVLFQQNEQHVNNSCSIAEADDPAYSYFLGGMAYVDYMNTHASSIVTAFERCLQINPEYEPRVRKYLDEARRRLT